MTVKLRDGSTLETEGWGFANRLREVRSAIKLTQTEMSEMLGISDRSYIYYEQGKRAIPLKLAVQFIKIHDLDSEWFLFGEDGRQNPLKKGG